MEDLDSMILFLRYDTSSAFFAGLSGIRAGWDIKVNDRFGGEWPPTLAGPTKDRRARHAGHCWVKIKAMFSYGLLHKDPPMLAG